MRELRNKEALRRGTADPLCFILSAHSLHFVPACPSAVPAYRLSSVVPLPLPLPLRCRALLRETSLPFAIPSFPAGVSSRPHPACDAAPPHCLALALRPAHNLAAPSPSPHTHTYTCTATLPSAPRLAPRLRQHLQPHGLLRRQSQRQRRPQPVLQVASRVLGLRREAPLGGYIFCRISMDKHTFIYIN